MEQVEVEEKGRITIEGVGRRRDGMIGVDLDGVGKGGARVEVGGSIGGSRRDKQGWKYEGVGWE